MTVAAGTEPPQATPIAAIRAGIARIIDRRAMAPTRSGRGILNLISPAGSRPTHNEHYYSAYHEAGTENRLD